MPAYTHAPHYDTYPQHITGTLTPAEGATLPAGTYRNIYTAVTKHNLYGIITSEGWKQGVIAIDHANTSTPKDNGSKAAPLTSPIDFIGRISRFVADKAISGLNLTGEITVTVPGPVPAVFRLHIHDNKVRYQQATLTWDETLHAF